MDNMYCAQCEQTASSGGCLKSGACGKSPDVARLQDELTGALITSSRKGSALPDRLFLEAMFATLTNVNFDEAALSRMIGLINEPFYNLYKIRDATEDIRSLKTLLLLGVRGVAAYAFHALTLGQEVQKIVEFCREALQAIASEDNGLAELLPLALRCGQANYEALELLDRAHTTTFGVPGPVQVSRVIEPGPFIVVSGHDLGDLKAILEQTAGQGVQVYTHGELLSGHAYPALRQFPHLKGHFGTAWPNQRAEFADLPGAIVFTTNCLTPPAQSYADRVFTTSVVGYPGLTHIGPGKDFSPVIQKALELRGYSQPQGAGTFTTGFGHNAVLAAAGPIIEAVKSGAIKHFFLVGGCDGARASRSYFRDFVQQSPQDTIILTLGCGKFRFNDLNLGEINGLPRLIDLGQCNDAYSAIKVALALGEAFNLGVNELPLTLVLSWYEQKAVSILLTLLFLGVKNIILGPTLPVFVSPTVLSYLVENFQIAPTSSPEADLARSLAR
ncbi:MAG: hydroxylamine reductase [Deltaproteobacteria bacterium]|jgi:hydroxylamine reductase|nr:hydroxylamine reductase [Deltaproteobacteria bacterium]